MFGKRWRSRNWWQDESYDLGFGSSRRWRNKVTKKPKNKRCAWQSNFDFLPDLDEQYDLLSSTLPLIGVSSGTTSSGINVDDIGRVLSLYCIWMTSLFFASDAHLLATCLCMPKYTLSVFNPRAVYC